MVNESVNNCRNEAAAIILGAGKGTRMKSDLPKVMMPVHGKPMIKHIIETLTSMKIQKIVTVISADGELVKKEVAPYQTVVQAEQFGTGHAVNCAKSVLNGFDGPVLIVFGDTPLITAKTFQKTIDKIREGFAVVVLGFKPGNTDVTSGELELAGYVDIFKQMVDKFNFKYVISSLRESYSASNNGWSACIYSRDDKEFYHSKKYTINPIVDRVGGGDSFAGGVICGFVDGKNYKDALEYGVAASALKHTIPGDFNLVTRADVDSLVGGDGSGRVQR